MIKCIAIGGPRDGKVLYIVSQTKEVNVPVLTDTGLGEYIYKVYKLPLAYALAAEDDETLSIGLEKMFNLYCDACKADEFANWAKGSEEKDKDKPF